MGLAKPQNEKDEKEGRIVVIPPPLMRYTKFNVEYDAASMMAKHYFKTHSNINEVLEKVMEIRKIPPGYKEYLLSDVIYCVVNISRSRYKYPYNLFKFNSLAEEIEGKRLLNHPEIEDSYDIDQIKKFDFQHGLRPCSVAMSTDNPLHNEIEKVVDRKRNKAKDGYEYNELFYRDFYFNQGLRRFYESTNQVEYIDFQTITLEKMCQISNFSHSVSRNFPGNHSQKEFEDQGSLLLLAYQQEPAIRFNDHKLLIDPKVYLLGNYISEEEEISILSMKAFYRKTNAKDLLRLHKDEISKGIDQSLNRRDRNRKILESFLLKYARQAKRNMPPFHDLYIRKDEEPANTSHNLRGPVNVDAESSSSESAGSMRSYKLKTRKLLKRKNKERAPDESPKRVKTDHPYRFVD